MANYRAAQSPNVSVTVTAGDVTYDTVMSLQFRSGAALLSSGAIVRPGDQLTAVVSLLVAGTNAPLANANVTLVVMLPGGGTLEFTGVTDGTGTANMDITSWLLERVGMEGAYSFQSHFAGILPTGGLPGYNASDVELYYDSSNQIGVY
jgi:hypothetical protein